MGDLARGLIVIVIFAVSLQANSQTLANKLTDHTNSRTLLHYEVKQAHSSYLRTLFTASFSGKTMKQLRQIHTKITLYVASSYVHKIKLRILTFVYLSDALNKRQKTYQLQQGKLLYIKRCSACHGITGQGDGRLAGVVIKDPAPFNLTKSIRDLSYLQLIIKQGGAAVNRSNSMPPWADEFSPQQVNAIAHYLLTLRQVR